MVGTLERGLSSCNSCRKKWIFFKNAACAFIVLLSVNSLTAVTGFLRADPVTLLAQGADSDAIRLYESLDIFPIEDSQGILEKQLQSPTEQISITCRLAEMSNSASCTIKIKHDDNFEVREESGRAYLVSYKNDDTQFIFNTWVKDENGRVPMYVSEIEDLA